MTLHDEVSWSWQVTVLRWSRNEEGIEGRGGGRGGGLCDAEEVAEAGLMYGHCKGCWYNGGRHGRGSDIQPKGIRRPQSIPLYGYLV